LLKRRGVTTSAAALSIVLSANAVQASPVGLAVTISTAAALGATTIASTATATATKAIVMTTLQKAIIGATLAAAVGTGIYATYEARQASKRRTEVQTLQQQQGPLVEQIQQLQREHDDATKRLASLTDENAALKRNPTEVLKLRGQVGSLRNQLQAATNAERGATTVDATAKALSTPAMRTSLAKARLVAYRQQYAPLIQQMKLTPEEAEKFINLLGENSQKLQDRSSAALREGTSRDAVIQTMQHLKNQVEDDLQTLLGSERYAQYQEFKLNRSAQATFDSLVRALPENSLGEDQRQRLFQLFRDNQPPGELETWWAIGSPGGIEDYFQRQAEIDRNILQQAGSFLTSEQLHTLASVQTARVSQQKEAFNLLRLMGTSGQGQAATGNRGQ
jgi:hypothetical protein